MLIFITSLKHPSTVASQDTMLRLLGRTLNTIEAQTCSDYRVIVVCHEIPQLLHNFARVEYVLVDFPPPAKDFSSLVYSEQKRDEVFREQTVGAGGNMIKRGIQIIASFCSLNRFGTFSKKSTVQEAAKNLELVKIDKGRKYLRGLYHARQYNPSHVMFFDADDCLSPDIVQTVLSGPQEKSWYVGNGYIYSEGSCFIVQRKNDFHTHCGTCYIFSMSIFDKLPERESDVPVAWYRDTLGSHRLVHTWLRSENIHLEKIPYPAVTYIINSGENHSGLNGYSVWVSRRGGIVRLIRYIFRLPSFRLLSDKIAQTFRLK